MKPGGRDANGKLEQHIHTRRGRLPVWLSQIIIPILFFSKLKDKHSTKQALQQYRSMKTKPFQDRIEMNSG